MQEMLRVDRDLCKILVLMLSARWKAAVKRWRMKAGSAFCRRKGRPKKQKKQKTLKAASGQQ